MRTPNSNTDVERKIIIGAKTRNICSTWWKVFFGEKQELGVVLGLLYEKI